MRNLVLFREQDLRVSDHAPLSAAARAGELVCAFVLEPRAFGAEAARGAPHRAQFRLDALGSLAANIERLGSRLVLLRGESADVHPPAARAWKIDRVMAHAA